MAKHYKWNIDKICFYPYGGFTKFSDDLNKPKREELLIMLAGPVIQIIYFYIMINFLNDKEIVLFSNYHYSILLFNLLPIYPLDGGKLINIVLNYFFPFRKSLRLSLCFSYLIITSIVLFFIKQDISLSLSIVLIILLVICKLTGELKKEKYYYNKFLLERYINNYEFPKIKVIKAISNMSRDYKHVIFKDNKTVSEKESLFRYFRQ